MSPCWKVREKLKSAVHSRWQDQRGAHSRRVDFELAGFFFFPLSSDCEEKKYPLQNCVILQKTVQY